MVKYSFNRDMEGIIFAHSPSDVNASFKDLKAVCDAIRYRNVEEAQKILDSVIVGGMPIEFRKNNSGMGSRHELGGKKGRYPKKCASLVKKVLINATANAKNKGYLPDIMYVVHASANRTQKISRLPSKGMLVVRGSHSMGMVSYRHSDIELAKIEIGIAGGEEKGISDNMKQKLKIFKPKESKNKPQAKKNEQKAKKPADKKTTEAKPAEKKIEEKKTSEVKTVDTKPVAAEKKEEVKADNKPATKTEETTEGV
jgi:ribosomal protein uL22